MPRHLGAAGGHRNDIEFAVVIDVGDRHHVSAAELVGDEVRAEPDGSGRPFGAGHDERDRRQRKHEPASHSQ